MRPRIVYFGSGSPLSMIVLRGVATRHSVAAVILPPQRRGYRETLKRWLGRGPGNPLVDAAAEFGIETFHYDEQSTPALVRSLEAELIAVATFPKLLPASLISSARRGGLNVHQSLLPRLRGPDPLFWSYYEDERETGSTVHWLDEAFDSGDIVAQDAIPIGRGRSIVDVYFELAGIGARQLADAIDAIFAKTDTRRPQDAARATSRPSPAKASWHVQFDRWGAERTWHFISGTAPIFGSMFRDPAGRPLPIRRAGEYRMERHGRSAGSIEETESGLRLFCTDGFVDVEPATRKPV
jgi:methionyl-tRNA formyltransferase